MALVLRASIEAGTPVKVFTSPLVRCVQTAAAIGRTLHVPVIPVASLGACALAVRTRGLRNYVDSAAAEWECGECGETNMPEDEECTECDEEKPRAFG
jgi:broad specificity phosphatase PhoE